MLRIMSIPKYRVGIYEANSVMKPTMLPSLRSLSQSFAITDDIIKIMVTTTPIAKIIKRTLQSLY